MRQLPRLLLALGLSALLSACGSSGPKGPDLGTGSDHTDTARLPLEATRHGGRYKIGAPYTVKGQRYYPEVDYAYDEVGDASWYGPGFHGKRTANGEIYDQNLMTAAHRTLPMPSLVRVTNLRNGRSVVVRVNDRGPFHDRRIIDMSAAAADALGFRNAGVTEVRVTILEAESRRLAAGESLSLSDIGSVRAADPVRSRPEMASLPSVPTPPVAVPPVPVMPVQGAAAVAPMPVIPGVPDLGIIGEGDADYADADLPATVDPVGDPSLFPGAMTPAVDPSATAAGGIVPASTGVAPAAPAGVGTGPAATTGVEAARTAPRVSTGHARTRPLIVRVARTRDKDRATQALNRLAPFGNAQVDIAQDDLFSDPLYEVFIGPLPADEAQALLGRVQQAGFTEAALVPQGAS